MVKKVEQIPMAKTHRESTLKTPILSNKEKSIKKLSKERVK